MHHARRQEAHTTFAQGGLGALIHHQRTLRVMKKSDPPLAPL